MTAHPIQLWLMTKPGDSHHPWFVIRDTVDDTLSLIDREHLLKLITEGGVWVQYSNHRSG